MVCEQGGNSRRKPFPVVKPFLLLQVLQLRAMYAVCVTTFVQQAALRCPCMPLFSTHFRRPSRPGANGWIHALPVGILTDAVQACCATAVNTKFTNVRSTTSLDDIL